MVEAYVVVTVQDPRDYRTRAVSLVGPFSSVREAQDFATRIPPVQGRLAWVREAYPPDEFMAAITAI